MFFPVTLWLMTDVQQSVSSLGFSLRVITVVHLQEGNFIFVGMRCSWGETNWYTLVNQQNYGKSSFFIGKSSINGPFSIAMLNYQRVYYTTKWKIMIMNAPKWGNTPDNYGEIYWYILELHHQKKCQYTRRRK